MLSTPVQLAEQLHSSRFSSDFIKLFFKVFCFCWNWTDSPTPLPFHSRYLNIGNIVVVRTIITYELWYEMWKHGTSSVLSTNCTLLDIMEEPFSPVWKALKANSGEKLLHLVISSFPEDLILKSRIEKSDDSFMFHCFPTHTQLNAKWVIPLEVFLRNHLWSQKFLNFCKSIYYAFIMLFLHICFLGPLL